MEIKAKCKFDLDSVRALTHLWMYKKADPKKRMRFWTISHAILLAIVILEIIVFDTDLILFVLLGIVIMMYLLQCYWYFVLPKIRYNAMAKMKEAENEYIFCDNIFKAFTKSDEYIGEAEIEYSLFVRVYETSKYFFLYQTNNQVFIVDKSTIEGGTAEDIRNKLLSYVGGRYLVCNY